MRYGPRYVTEQKTQHFKVLLEPRLNKLGRISVKDAWQVLQPYQLITYSGLTKHFRAIMCELIKKNRAYRLRGGVYWINNNSITQKINQ